MDRDSFFDDAAIITKATDDSPSLKALNGKRKRCNG
jgi:hypothetical protein